MKKIEEDKLVGSSSDGTPMKCRKCRQVLLEFPFVKIGDSCKEWSITSDRTSRCKSDVWYIAEDNLPDWISCDLDRGEWIKGKLNCPKCDARVGSYNFVSGFKCNCGSEVVPPIHMVKSKVDFTAAFGNIPQQCEEGRGVETQ